MELSDYLKHKHLEYCNEIGGVIPESDWVNDVLNEKLPSDDRLSYPSVNQWMNGPRRPDSKNIIRLIKIFGADIMPSVGIYLPADLARLIRDWDELAEEAKQEIADIAKKATPDLETIQY